MTAPKSIHTRGQATPFGWLPAPKASDACPERHARKDPGTRRWDTGSSSTLGYIVQGNGTISYRFTCGTCGTRSSAVPVKVATWLINNGTPVSCTQVNEPLDYPGCTVAGCTDDGVDQHHFAPRNTFGSDAESWPVMPLCRRHHVEWHQRMDGYRWHARRSA